jgi:hypothetical protein
MTVNSENQTKDKGRTKRDETRKSYNSLLETWKTRRTNLGPYKKKITGLSIGLKKGLVFLLIGPKPFFSFSTFEVNKN